MDNKNTSTPLFTLSPAIQSHFCPHRPFHQKKKKKKKEKKSKPYYATTQKERATEQGRTGQDPCALTLFIPSLQRLFLCLTISRLPISLFLPFAHLSHPLIFNTRTDCWTFYLLSFFPSFLPSFLLVIEPRLATITTITTPTPTRPSLPTALTPSSFFSLLLYQPQSLNHTIIRPLTTTTTPPKRSE